MCINIIDMCRQDLQNADFIISLFHYFILIELSKCQAISMVYIIYFLEQRDEVRNNPILWKRTMKIGNLINIMQSFKLEPKFKWRSSYSNFNSIFIRLSCRIKDLCNKLVVIYATGSYII